MPNARTFVPPRGVLEKAKYILVGEQPGRRDVTSRRAFSDHVGRQLMECLGVAKISQAECYFTNVIKDLDKPLYQYVNQSRGKVTLTKEGLYYYDYLEKELQSGPKIIFALGNVALNALFGEWSTTKWRGSILKSDKYPNRYIIPTLNPDTVVAPKFQYLNKLLIETDLTKGSQIQKNGWNPLKRQLITKPTYHESLDFLEKMQRRGLRGRLVAFDIEIYNEEVSCISFSTKADEAMSIPFVGNNGDYFSVSQEAEIWSLICKILEDASIRKLGQNLSFDSHFLLRKYGIRTTNTGDTMVAQKIIMPDYPMGLDFITSIWTDHPYYKAEGKKYFGGGGWPQLWDYNATDSVICVEAFPKQRKELANQGNLRTYERQTEIIEPLVYMQERGIKVDRIGMEKYRLIMLEELTELQLKLNNIVGHEINSNSPKQLKEYFYGKAGKGLKAYKSRATGKSSVDDNALKRLIRKGFKEASVIRRMRKIKKITGTYLTPEKYDSDDRIRCSYNPAGTRYSRISSSKNIFGTGMNLQNWPHEILKFLMIDDGYVGYFFDLAQAENRIVAYVGNVKPMIEAFEGGLDVHSLTAALIFQKSVNDVTEADGTCPLGDGTHGERFWGKKANHGLNYDLGYKTFAFLYEISERDAKFIVDRYHLSYPGVRNIFHASVRRQLRENRTLINLMGRKTLFLDKWGDSLFKEAYSCIPQGSVGDIINERGLNYIYYNQDRFKPIELLTQVHDEIGFQIPLTSSWIDHARMLLDIKRELEIPLFALGREFVIPADLTIAQRFKTGQELKGDKFPKNPYTLAKKLEEIYKSNVETAN